MLVWHREVAGDEIEFFVRGSKIVITPGIARTQSRATRLIINIKKMQAILHLGTIGERTKPGSIRDCIGRKIQDDAYTCRQYADNQRL